MTPLTDGCHNDDVIQLAPLRSQSLFQFVHMSDAYFLHLLSRYFPHSVIKWIQIWRIWGHSCGGMNSGVSFCINSMVARAQWTYQVSRGSVETLFRWGGKHHYIANLFRKQCITFHRNRPSFVWDITKKHLGLFFSGHMHCIDMHINAVFSTTICYCWCNIIILFCCNVKLCRFRAFRMWRYAMFIPLDTTTKTRWRGLNIWQKWPPRRSSGRTNAWNQFYLTWLSMNTILFGPTYFHISASRRIWCRISRTNFERPSLSNWLCIAWCSTKTGTNLLWRTVKAHFVFAGIKPIRNATQFVYQVTWLRYVQCICLTLTH